MAAESLQLEHEAYMLRSQGKGKGHSGFHNQRHFDISGSVSFQERKARLAQLKSRTECRRFGQKGHWSGDSACPKGGRKEGGKKSNKSSPTSSPTSSGKHGSNSGKTNKPRVVYFSMAEDEKTAAQGPRVAMMAYRGARPKASSGGRASPPPECLNAGAGTTSLSSPTTSPQCSSMAMATAPISMLSSLIPSIAADPGALPDREAIERAWMMQQQVRLEVAEQNSLEEVKPEAGSSQGDLGETALNHLRMQELLEPFEL